MATITQMKSRTDEEFSRLTDEEIMVRYFQKNFNYEGLAGLTDQELDDWIDDYVSYLEESHSLKKDEIPILLSHTLKRLIRERM